MKRTKHRKKGCVYCGIRDGNTKDHVPPKSFFPQNQRDAITVPCCDVCQQQFRKDEDFFHKYLFMGPAGVTSTGKQIREESINRAILGDKPKDPSIRDQIKSCLKMREIRTNSGIYMNRWIVDPGKHNTDRIKNVISKIFRGLYWHEYKEPFPAGEALDIDHIDPEIDPVSVEIWKQCILQPAKCWDGIFEYHYKREIVDSIPAYANTVFLMSFCRTNYYLVSPSCMTVNKGALGIFNK